MSSVSHFLPSSSWSARRSMYLISDLDFVAAAMAVVLSSVHWLTFKSEAASKPEIIVDVRESDTTFGQGTILEPSTPHIHCPTGPIASVH